MKIICLSADFSTDAGRVVAGVPMPGIAFAGSWHYRMNLPGTALRDLGGHTVVFNPRLEQDPDGRLCPVNKAGRRERDYDAVWLQRWMGERAPEQIRRARAAGQVVVNEVDDWYLGVPTSNLGFYASHVQRDRTLNRDHYLQSLHAGDGCIVSTPYLAQRLGERGIRCEVCPNAIDIDRWPVLDPTVHEGTVGWVGTLGYRASDLEVLRGVLGPFLERHDLAFHHGGHRHDIAGPDAAERLGLNAATTTWSVAPAVYLTDYPSLWTKFDVAVIPLEDTSFNLAKSNLKALEASASGLPWIASDLPEQRALGYGRLAKRPDQWRKHLEALCDPVLRKEEGLANRAEAEKHSIDKRWRIWEEAFHAFGVV